jgi:sterol desaturase/sphingolipid hydroxylase (fatty acid hydroxylase superfamily)
MVLDWIPFRDFLLFLLVFTPFEHLLPIHQKSLGLRRGWLTDVLHFFLSGIVIRFGLTAVIVAAAIGGHALIPLEVTVAVQGLPLVLQVILATIIADLGFYLAHRAMHSIPALWHFHAIHHSSEELDWLAAYRVHPVDQVIVKGASLLPIFVLGFSTTAIGIAAVIYHWQALLIHSNIKVPLGPLRLLVAGPEFHHWHHANEREAYDKNFSGQLPLWDVLFKTLHLPGRMPERYGVNDNVPEGYLAQMAYPFRKLGAEPDAEGPDTTVRPAEGAVSRDPA